MKKQRQKYSEAENRLENLKIKADEAGRKLKSGISDTGKGAAHVASGFEKMGTKLLQLAKGALIFSVITRAFTALRQAIGSALMSNDGFRQSLYQLQAAFWTAFAPIYNYVLPALQSMINFITNAIMAVVQLFAALTGKTVSAMVNNGKALQQQTSAYKSVGAGAGKAAKGMKKATDEAKKQIAAFDELNILTEEKAAADNGGGGGGGGGSVGEGIGAFDELQHGGTILDKFADRLNEIADIFRSGFWEWVCKR